MLTLVLLLTQNPDYSACVANAERHCTEVACESGGNAPRTNRPLCAESERGKKAFDECMALGEAACKVRFP